MHYFTPEKFIEGMNGRLEKPLCCFRVHLYDRIGLHFSHGFDLAVFRVIKVKMPTTRDKDQRVGL